MFETVVRPLQAFIKTEAASGILLLASAVLALSWANLQPQGYREVFEVPLTLAIGGARADFSVQQLINDGLMAIFFFVVGMEIKRELVSGELNSVGKASLPAIAAMGGMVLPALIFFALNRGGAGAAGWGIPMATDIAFCVGILALLKGRVPHALVVFVTALAIFDDIGGILVIALFYGHGLNASALLLAALVLLIAFALNRAYVVNGLVYGAVGAALWYALHQAGIHATISGVLLGLMVPAQAQRNAREVLIELVRHTQQLCLKPQDEELEAAEILAIEEKLEDLQAPCERFIHLLHPFVAFLIMPLFALANSGVTLTNVSLETLAAPVTLGAALGLFVGKQLGIFGTTLLALQLGIAPMPRSATYAKLFGVCIIAGIGFTVALFIAALAYPASPALLAQAKIGILLGSLLAGVVGFVVLRLTPSADRR